MKKSLLAISAACWQICKHIWTRYSILFWYGLGVGLLAWMVWTYRDKILELLGGKEPFHWRFLALALAVNAVSLVITFVRWHVLVRAQDFPFKLVDAMRLGLLGLFWSTVLPGSVTGDIPKAYFLAKEQTRRSVAVATILIDRGLGLCALFWLVALLGSIFWIGGSLEQMVTKEDMQWKLKFIIVASIGIFLASLLCWVLVGLFSGNVTARALGRLERRGKIGHALAELGRAVLLYRARGRAVMIAMVMAMIAHVGFVLTFYLCSLTLFEPKNIPPVRTHYLIVPVGMTFQGFFPAPGGMGGAEAAYGVLYHQVGAGDPNTEIAFEGSMACFMQRVLSWVLAGVAILVYLFMKPAGVGAAAEEKEAGGSARDPVAENA